MRLSICDAGNVNKIGLPGMHSQCDQWLWRVENAPYPDLPRSALTEKIAKVTASCHTEGVTMPEGKKQPMIFLVSLKRNCECRVPRCRYNNDNYL